ncbi:MAG: glycoside hydrolase family 2 TIM barrel-domain containing protein [Bacteroidota bacterium]|nr:glycoside hydrolase family 2 TIM barrel-domain containing protein [Bacteroidota bacterium]
MHLQKSIYLLLLIFMTTTLSFGQSSLNFGLTSPQDPSTLPKSAVAAEKPVRKAWVKPVTVLQTVHDNEWAIRGGWELAEASKVIASQQSLFHPQYNTSEWYNATVPGTVLSTLVDQGVYPDPYFGLNNLAIPESLCRTDWWYRTSFKLPAGNENKIVWLLFNGINYSADVWLNGKQFGAIRGAFIRGEFNATDLLKRDGENILAVHILPPPNPGIPHEESPSSGRGPNGGQLCLDGPTFISSEGWDWVPGIRDRNIGIWQDVCVRYTNQVTIADPQVVTKLPLPDTTSATVSVSTEVVNNSSVNQQVTLNGTIGNITFSQNVSLKAGEHKLVTFTPAQFPQIQIKNPRLWWPNGYGKPELYTLKLSVVSENNEVSDNKTVRFGIRELSYELTVDAPGKKDWRVEFNPISAMKDGKPLFDNINRRSVGDGVSIPKLRDDVDASVLTELQDKGTAPYLVIKVNGRRIFCKGGNWGMDDAMKRVSREHLEPYFRLHRDAHFNMVRNWTGESTEEVFYELCDEYGLLVWNDFWLSTEGYNLNVNDDNLFLDNARDVIRRFRNHPSIAIWCPRNEGFAPQYLEENLSAMIVKEDGTRYYQPNSRYMNLRPSGPWHYFKDASEYFRNNAKGFNSELGTPSVPTAASMRKMMAKEDVWPISDAWYYHDLHFGQKEYCQAIDTLYGKSNSVEEFCKKAQMVNYDSHRAMFESWNSKMWNNTSGLLLWMTHPAWPSTVWQVYSWDYETFGSYFGSLKACERVHAQMNLHDNKVIVVNTSLNNLVNARISLMLYDLSGKLLFRNSQTCTAPGNQLTYCFTPSLPANLPDVYLARLVLSDKSGREVSVNEYWKTTSKTNGFTAFNKLIQVGLKGKVLKKQSGVQSKMEFEIANTSKVPAIGVKLNLRKKGSGELILPAYFSEGYFTLLPGERKRISVDFNGPDIPELVADGYNVVNETVAFIGIIDR